MFVALFSFVLINVPLLMGNIIGNIMRLAFFLTFVFVISFTNLQFNEKEMLLFLSWCGVWLALEQLVKIVYKNKRNSYKQSKV